MLNNSTKNLIWYALLAWFSLAQNNEPTNVPNSASLDGVREETITSTPDEELDEESPDANNDIIETETIVISNVVNTVEEEAGEEALGGDGGEPQTSHHSLAPAQGPGAWGWRREVNQSISVKLWFITALIA